MAALENLIPAQDKPRLRKAVDKRFSCRDFSKPLSLEDWAALSYIAGRYSMAGARLILQRVPEALFTGTLLSMNRVSGCTSAAIVVAEQGIRAAKINAGILGELLCLEAIDLGLASCWITGSYRAKLLEAPLTSREEVLAVIALGHPTPAEPRPLRRKPIEHICTTAPDLWPPVCLRAAELVRKAPSAMNLQPWMLSCENNCFAIDAAERSHLELGIALAHAELVFTGPHEWRIGQSNYEPAAFVYV